MNRFGNSYLVTTASVWAVIVAAMVAFVMLVSLQALHDWPGPGLGIHLGGDGGSDTSGSAKQAVAGAKAVEVGATRVAGAAATGSPPTSTAKPAVKEGKPPHPVAIGGTKTTGAGDGVAAVSPASATAAPVQGLPPNTPSGGEDVPVTEAGGGSVPTPGGEGGGGAAVPSPGTGSTAPPSTRTVNPGAVFGLCKMQGAARFSPGLNSSSQAVSYELTGELEGCWPDQTDNIPTTGTISVGAVISEQVINSVTGATDTVEYQEPIPIGDGGCESIATEGQALETWADGTQTVVMYSTTGALAGARLSGNVAPSMTLSAVNPELGDPAAFTIETTRYAGEAMVGMLTIEPPDPSACASPDGAATTEFSGYFGPVGP